MDRSVIRMVLTGSASVSVVGYSSFVFSLSIYYCEFINTCSKLHCHKEHRRFWNSGYSMVGWLIGMRCSGKFYPTLESDMFNILTEYRMP